MIGWRCGTGKPTSVRLATSQAPMPSGRLIRNTQRHDRYSVM